MYEYASQSKIPFDCMPLSSIPKRLRATRHQHHQTRPNQLRDFCGSPHGSTTQLPFPSTIRTLRPQPSTQFALTNDLPGLFSTPLTDTQDIVQAHIPLHKAYNPLPNLHGQWSGGHANVHAIAVVWDADKNPQIISFGATFPRALDEAKSLRHQQIYRTNMCTNWQTHKYHTPLRPCCRRVEDAHFGNDDRGGNGRDGELHKVFPRMLQMQNCSGDSGEPRSHGEVDLRIGHQTHNRTDETPWP